MTSFTVFDLFRELIKLHLHGDLAGDECLDLKV